MSFLHDTCFDKKMTEYSYCRDDEILRVADSIFRPADGTFGDQALQFCITNAEVRDSLPSHVNYSSRRSFCGAYFQSQIQASQESAAFEKAFETHVLLYGVTQAGVSVLAKVRGFRPMLRFMLKGSMSARQLVSRMVDAPEDDSTKRQRSERGWQPSDAEKMGVDEDEVEYKEEMLEKSWGYDPSGVIKVAIVTFSTLRAYYRTRRNFTDCKIRHSGSVEMEEKVDPYIQFIANTGFRPCGWVSTVMDKSEQGPEFTPVREVPTTLRISHSAIEFTCGVKMLQQISQSDGTPKSEIPDQLTWCFDGEMQSEERAFPDATLPNDFISAISMDAKFFYADRSTTVVLCIGLPERPVKTETVLCFRTEKDLLNAFRDLIALTCPQFLTGFNQMGFDWPYIDIRARKVGAKRIYYGGRLVLQKAALYTKTLDSAARGSNDMALMQYSGVSHIDVMKEVMARYKMESYSLNSCCEKFLGGKQKYELPYIEMMDLVAAGKMAKVVEYAGEDARLPNELIDVMHVIASFYELARVTGTPVDWLVLRGQQIKIFIMLYIFCRINGLFLNKPLVAAIQGYVGATVLDPEKDFFTDPVATLDFASLYPSIMMAHNLCFSTLVMPQIGSGTAEIETHTLPNGKEVSFVKAASKPGILPRMLKEILAARKLAKAAKKRAKDPMEEIVQDERQRALKVSANSIYGFCAAQMYPCQVISEVVTNKGRQMIEETKQLVESVLPPEIIESVPGFKPRVIYGDTDSVMVLCPGLTVDQCWLWGTIAAKIVTDFFPGEIELEMEEIKWPYLLLKKKRYVARTWTQEGECCEPGPKIDYKGIELKRRDNAPIVKQVQLRVLLTLFAQELFDADESGRFSWVEHVANNTMRDYVSKTTERAIAALKEELKQIIDSKLPLEKYVLSKSLAREYKNDSQPHVNVVKLKEKRMPGSGDRVGSRVQFFYRKKTSEEEMLPKSQDKVSARSEDPEYALANGILPDRIKYLSDVRSAIASIFDPIGDPRVADTFDGAHGDIERQEKRQTDITSFFTALPQQDSFSGLRPVARGVSRKKQTARQR